MEDLDDLDNRERLEVWVGWLGSSLIRHYGILGFSALAGWAGT